MLKIHPLNNRDPMYRTSVSPTDESGDSSVVTHWTVRPLRGCRFEFHPRRKFNFCRALALRVFSAHSVPAFGGRGPPHRAGT